MSLARKEARAFSHAEPEAWPGRSHPSARQGVEGATQDGAGAAAQNTGHGPKGLPVCPSLRLDIWEKSFKSGQTSALNSFPLRLVGPFFLFSNSILGGSFRQSPRQGSQASLSLENWSHGSPAETSEWQRDLHLHLS